MNDHDDIYDFPDEQGEVNDDESNKGIVDEDDEASAWLKSKNNELDDIGMYLKATCSAAPLLTEKEEQHRMRVLEIHRTRFRRFLLNNANIQNVIIEKIQNMLNGVQGRIDRILHVGIQNAAEKERLKAINGANMHTIVSGLQAKEYRNTKGNRQRRKRDNGKVRRMLEESGIRLTHLQAAMRSLHEKMQDMRPLYENVFTENNTMRTHPDEESAEQLAHMEEMLGTTYPELRDWLERASVLQLRYQESLNALVTPNLRLVVNVTTEEVGFADIDLMQQGIDGLRTAADSFNRKLGNRFSTFATQGIVNAVKQGKRERRKQRGVTATQDLHITRFYRARNAVQQRLGKTPNMAELAAEMNMQEQDVEALYHSLHMRSLDDDCGREGNGHVTKLGSTLDAAQFRKTITDDTFEEPDKVRMLEIVRQVLEEEDPRAFYIITQRHSRTLQNIADEIGKSKERVRQIETRGIAKARWALHEAGIEDVGLDRMMQKDMERIERRRAKEQKKNREKRAQKNGNGQSSPSKGKLQKVQS